ncbi:tRNA uridine-5-carboxymethylaminomethyl(34) synthesis enzyme MnmG [Ethanoligenens harbinense]|uniref:tRNA uridine 5-carboxymethylaminomethyl modification enzyme MnmG n=1 Tax=Ethanoligenens harbinense (strain DSM 18485 / JCM 12961 / CGMCC 1.5033 / YUAN-3) TaxID=663278 RepID=E6U8G7_ETHHY|nr:tRNA uridine-5-carboxymethylaminomethyl(34) synthesis enzyme MnmG [Ethanoligenens harbinense]ADU28286.1 glucose inhibited division protein A [Ethanoligenens harbinense YUAN-3]AVQ97280.1 tRNA uridine-5-carboxymethylaminomethyl(34) synthesis enzyme MnmG [Ethanoligenens harbinense YUAN-3]AYF39944.1 tRNA uridine-5-carboxymethylaminomethyl(34) synthesis enzyme MnmG [Ethanoligenens harbinense]AYF42774.1 tRNA uridine-5-carboxymethylaminomethyl(34) synthesis enzyme MnmG [Ethanoligenens harbinense]Q
MEYQAGAYGAAVIGAGHAGIEAALACARLGVPTVLFTLNLDAVANMPCNPSIGGTAKGHLVREIDALGGEMGRAADATFLQSRMLNRGKGPAVHSLRMQCDRRAYHARMKHVLETTPLLDLKQAEVVEIRVRKGAVSAVVTRLGAVFTVRAVVIATGTYLRGRVHIGEVSYESGPDGMFGPSLLSDNLQKLGLPLLRFKTGTPARVKRASIDFSTLEVQTGDNPVIPFSFETENPGENTAVCHIAYTNAETHHIIRENLHRSPLYAGRIEGVGPRYCPSIEDKVVRFADKERHQIFIEPLGKDTEELYLGGISSSLPEEVQMQFLRTIKGFDHIRMMRTAYAIEYDCIDPLALTPMLETKAVQGLYGAGQFNGTSGYEEAAAQGLMAGINAALQIKGEVPLVLSRAQAYIGTLIDDLVTKGTNEPYRMMTSRAEYRLVLRQDNADMRLTPIGYRIGLISDERFVRFKEKQRQIQTERQRTEKIILPPSAKLNAYLEQVGTTPLTTGAKLADLLRRPQVHYDALAPFDLGRPVLPEAVREQVEISVKYEGYIKRENAAIEQMHRLEQRVLPPDIDYRAVSGLRLEAMSKLEAVRPINIAQASRISGVSPADISVLLIYLEQRRGADADCFT